ncbi:MAG: ribonuclease H-like domain-containing protein [Blastocatellia bacterium]|nr:ribonuclease H-like domain-containing protein [Blastocatellia bacterium]
MLKNTFLHIPRIGKATERRFWEKGITTWEEALQASRRDLGVSDLLVKDYIERSFKALDNQDTDFFAELLPTSEMWRLIVTPELATKAGYLDIETNGMNPNYSIITVVGLFDGQDVSCFVYGKNLEELYEEIEKYNVLVTFNGKCFDVPFLKAALPGIKVPLAHVDLRYILRQAGFSGGLKKIERYTGLARNQDELGTLDGLDAVLLWQLYERGEQEALTTLMRYNAEDIVGLKPLLELACNMLIKEIPLSIDLLEVSERVTPDIPYSQEVIRQVKMREW